eukprot:8823089-Alexandrium_andersonii.AAC.1
MPARRAVWGLQSPTCLPTRRLPVVKLLLYRARVSSHSDAQRQPSLMRPIKDSRARPCFLPIARRPARRRMQEAAAGG